MKLPIKFLVLTALVLLTSPGYSAEKPRQKWYRVEVIIFTQKDVFGDELSSRDIVLKYPKNMIDLDNNRVAYTPLANSERKLSPDAYSLNRTGVYKVLFHKAWKQPGLAPANAPWINIDISDDNTALRGSLRVYLSSYLHMESNIWRVTYAAETTSISEGGFIRVEDNAFKAAQRDIDDIILLKQASRLKLNKLHYFDHPKMGLLFKVSRAVAPVIAQRKPMTVTETGTSGDNVLTQPTVNEDLANPLEAEPSP